MLRRCRHKRFLSTLSLRRATITLKCNIGTIINFYPRSPCGERLVNPYKLTMIFGISIHALLAESDLWDAPEMPTQEISIHALLAESDLRVMDDSKSSIISIHALLAESDIHHRTRRRSPSISIHALLAESDFWRNRQNKDLYLFLSTLSLRRATLRGCSVLRDVVISIHALLAESDTNWPTAWKSNTPFLSTLSLRRATY